MHSDSNMKVNKLIYILISIWYFGINISSIHIRILIDDRAILPAKLIKLCSCSSVAAYQTVYRKGRHTSNPPRCSIIHLEQHKSFDSCNVRPLGRNLDRNRHCDIWTRGLCFWVNYFGSDSDSPLRRLSIESSAKPMFRNRGCSNSIDWNAIRK